MLKKTTIALGVAMSIGLAFGASAKTVIKIGHGAAEAFHMHRALLKFEELVEAGSNNEIDVQIFPSSQMGPDREMIEGVQTGVLEMIRCPSWCFAHLREGIVPRMRFFDDYVPVRGRQSFTHAGAIIRGIPDWEYLDELRQEWDGKLIVKGVLRPEDAKRMVALGVDCIWVSNHSGRQFEAGPAVIDQLPKIREAVGGHVPLIYDSGVSWGLDIMRALAYGADFVMLGRAFQFAVAAFGAKGIDHLVHVLKADIQANMSQLGAESTDQLSNYLLGENSRPAKEWYGFGG